LAAAAEIKNCVAAVIVLRGKVAVWVAVTAAKTGFYGGWTRGLLSAE
jgi:hypothetical protein